MTQRQKQRLLCLRIKARLEGKPFFMIGDIVRIKQNTLDKELPEELIGQEVKIISRRPAYSMPYAVSFPNIHPRLHTIPTHVFTNEKMIIREKRGWWADVAALELVKRVEEE